MSMDRDQQKAMFAKMGSRGTRDTSPQLSRSTSKARLTPQMSSFISNQIRKELKAGKGQQQSVAIAFSKARSRFGNGRLIPVVKNKPKKDLDKRTERLLFTLLGAAIAIAIIKRIQQA
jgi:hypothetical protein